MSKNARVAAKGERKTIKKKASTLRAYRIVKDKYCDNAFDGEGARLHGGRWNSKGTSAVYLSDSVSLAILEVLIHTNDQRSLANWCLFEMELPLDEVVELPIDMLPEDWNSSPAASSTMIMGDVWLRSDGPIALRVPSTAVPFGGNNFVINPQHPRFAKLIQGVAPFGVDIDPRLLS